MTYSEFKMFIPRILPLFMVLGFLATNVDCAKKGLVTEEYSKEFYHINKLLPDKPMDKNPKFIVYGDNRPGWRINEKFLKRENWFTWKMSLFPFYEVYWLGNGFVGGIEWLCHTPDCGVQERRMVRDAIYDEAKRWKVDFIINGGDMATDGQRPSHWETFLKENKIERPLVLDFPFLPVVGNHDKTNDLNYGLPNYEAIFDYPRFYVLDFPDAALFVVDSNFIIDQDQLTDDDEQDALFEKWFVAGKDSEQPAWLERELASRKQSFKIVMMHHPPISFGKHYSNWANPSYGRNLPEKRQQLLKLFYEQGVQIVLCCHEHAYEHNVLQYPSDKNGSKREIHFIVTGGGGAPLYPNGDDRKIKKFIQNYRAEGLDVLLLKKEVIYHYCLVDIR